MEIFGIRKLREELECAKSEAKEYKRLHSEMAKSFESLQKDRDRIKELYEAEKAAREKENGCVRGIYCHYCKHHVMGYTVHDHGKCYCTYGACPHFEKEAGHEPDN